MNKNPKVIGRTRVLAETLAETVNSFVEVISWRTMIFLLATMAILVGYTNSTISSYRRNHIVQNQYQAQQQQSNRPPLKHMQKSAPPAISTEGTGQIKEIAGDTGEKQQRNGRFW